MDLSPKFERRVRDSECNSNNLRVPHAFCLKYGDRLPATVKVVVCNDYTIWLDFDKVNERFTGLRACYEGFSIKSGHTLLFEYCGDFDFKVCIVDLYGSEIEYPYIVHHLQTCEPGYVSIRDEGWTFVRHLGWGGKAVDSLVLPYEFVDHVGHLIPARVEFVVSSDHEIVGCYHARNKEISGLVNVCNILDVSDLNVFHLLVFNVDGTSRFKITVFDATHIEAPLSPPNSPLGHINGDNSTAFRFVVQKFHMYEYSHGVDILVEFKNLCSCWRNTDYITAYVGNRCWKLQVRHRSDWKRTTINDGWCLFRDDLQLAEDDVCVFEWKNDMIRNFDVRIVKAVYNGA